MLDSSYSQVVCVSTLLALLDSLFISLFVCVIFFVNPTYSRVFTSCSECLSVGLDRSVKRMSDERQSRPTFVGVVELPDKIGRQNR